ncbi:MAG: hypothetical protein KatS3mg058_1475 [Roseiflexus sp.]|nr:MAG: hypothetical protein KatS3mg058_1475 [Roseiflexus sp.]
MVLPLRALRVLGGEAFVQGTHSMDRIGSVLTTKPRRAPGDTKDMRFMVLPLRALRVLGGEAFVQGTHAWFSQHRQAIRHDLA